MFDEDWKQMVVDGAKGFGVTPKADVLDMMAFHASELVKWNRKFNITAITDPHEVAVKHFVDALALVSFVPEGARMVDLGSGGGFPGLPLKVCRPDVQVVMLDASRKKVGFLNHVVRMAGLTGVRAVHGRVEMLGVDVDFAQRFDVVASRAFTSLGRFVELSVPFLSEQGVILAMKGDVSPAEIREVNPENFEVTVAPYRLSPGDHRRAMVTVRPLKKNMSR